MKRNITEALRTRRLYFDGATGSVLLSRGLSAGTPPEAWNDERPDEIVRLHREYLAAGADIIKTNSFGISPLKYTDYNARVRRALALANEARAEYADAYVALDIGPLGKLIAPLGDLDFEDAVAAYRSIALAGCEGADLVLIETVSDVYEAKAAVLGVREACDLPIFVSCVFDRRGKLMTGADPKTVIATLEGLGVSAIGMNCAEGPDGMLEILPTLAERASVPVIVNPNAGLPRVEGGRAVYDLGVDDFASKMVEVAGYATVLGGCCGTSPEYIRAMKDRTCNVPFFYPEKKNITTISSYTHTVDIGGAPILIGERINPTGKPKLKEAIREHNLDYLITEALTQADAGAHVLDVNVGLPGIDEAALMREAVYEIQAVTDLPLQIDSSDPLVLERAMRMYNGKPLVNSVNGKEESMSAVLPLVKKYGASVIALTIDEGGIPDTAEGRVAIAERIIERAAEYGIAECEIIVDPLTLSVSADKNAAKVTLEAVRLLNEKGIRTSLGVSNVSFGLPARDKLNSAFFAAALAKGLDAAIMNPHSEPMMDVFTSFRALSGYDRDFLGYIARNSCETAPRVKEKEEISLTYAVRHGMKEASARAAAEALVGTAPLDIINNLIIPALNDVGSAFESGKAYLPELLSSAEAASSAFEVVKGAIPTAADSKKKIVLATVKGDIHDIGKNIVKVMLESYGFTCIDLGRDVAPERILEATVECGAGLVGLSALMTTTVGAMEDTVRLIHERAEGVRVMVGGAVLNDEYASMIGADFYAKDAMEGVRIAEAFFGGHE